MKVCSKCHNAYPEATSYYVCNGRVRAECKACSKLRNMTYAKLNKPWLTRDPEKRREYDREYYHANIERFAEYRAAFRKRHPGYFRLYQQNKRSPLKPEEKYIKD